MLRNKSRCAYCEDGPFDMTELVEGPSDENIIQGYYFCGWCLKHGEPNGDDDMSHEERLLEQAKQKTGVSPVFDPEAETWTDPFEEL